MATLAALLLVAKAELANAAPVVHIVAGSSSCPTSQAFAAALSGALPGAEVSVGGAVGFGAQVVLVIDLGDRYRVLAADDEREFIDSARRCDERARAAAVFVALALDPANAPQATPPPKPPAPPAIPPRPPPPPPLVSPDSSTVRFLRIRDAVDRRPALSVEAAVTPAFAPGTTGHSSAYSIGAGVRLIFGVAPIALSIGAAVFAPSIFDLRRERMRLQRAPFDVGLRGRIRRGAFEGSLEVGFALSLLEVTGLGFPIDQSGLIIDLGARIAVRGALHATNRLAPFAAVEANASAPHDLLVSGAPVGTTPRVWLQLSVGVAVRIF